MKLLNSFKNKCLEVDASSFSSLALELFQFQAENCEIYRNYLANLNVDINKITEISQIPCLPIEFFKTHSIKTGDWEEVEVYQSSGTTGQSRSRHLIEDPQFYLNNATRIFEEHYDQLTRYMFFALLPSYQEQGHSSLVKMVDHFIAGSKSFDGGGFYLNRPDELITNLEHALHHSKRSVILFGVGYALLDLADILVEKGKRLDGLTIIETGGMKGRRKEMVKEEFYQIMKEKFGAVNIHSEYGMTELLSQAYSFDGKSYSLPNQMSFIIRDPEDPFHSLENGKAGAINVIDLANVHSCAFIETRDLGIVTEDGKLQVLGRLDNSDIRGCNLLVV